MVLVARAIIARYEDTRDLRLIGRHQQGTDPELDKSAASAPRLYDFFDQRSDEALAENPIAVMASLIQMPPKT